ncbi:MAG: hypothetical protein Q8K12_12680 [Thiobacillus sp.]|nr:hypothetical protein [Thiobacillus sp.]
MDWLTFSSKVIESLAWPMVALVLGLVFRKKLLDLIPAIRRLKAGPLEAEFELAAKQVLVNAAEASLQNKPITSGSAEDKRDEGRNEIVASLLNARNDPAGMILAGWAKVDGELFRLGRQLGDIVDPLTSTTKVYESVMSSNVLPVETRRLIRELRELRNKVAHVKVVPSSDSAQDYVLAVDRVVELILNYRKNLHNYGPTNQ